MRTFLAYVLLLALLLIAVLVWQTNYKHTTKAENNLENNARIAKNKDEKEVKMDTKTNIQTELQTQTQKQTQELSNLSPNTNNSYPSNSSTKLQQQQTQEQYQEEYKEQIYEQNQAPIKEQELVNIDESYLGAMGLCDVQKIAPKVLTDMRYASSDNLAGKPIYQQLTKCYVPPDVAQMLQQAQENLDKKRPGFRLLLLDCVRPLSAQKTLWNKVKGTSKQRYVANPKKHSLHNYGAAVDITLADSTGNEIDMGTPFDHLGDEAQTRYHSRFLNNKQLTQTHINNRMLLKQVMKQAGFQPILSEWWHFNACNIQVAKQKYKLIK